MSKPREFWIIEDKVVKGLFVNILQDANEADELCLKDEEIIHVIEYSAYEELRKYKIAALVDMHKFKSQLDIAVEALEYYTNNQKAGSYTGIAKQALKRLEERLGE